MWHKMGKCLGQWAPPVFWNFTSEQVQKNLLKYLEKTSCHQIIPERHKPLQCAGAGPGHEFNRAQCPWQAGKVPGTESKVTEPMAEPEHQPVPVFSAPVRKEK